MCAAENMQRQDLSDVECVESIVEMIEDDSYAAMGESPVKRISNLLGRLDSVRVSRERGSDVAPAAE